MELVILILVFAEGDASAQLVVSELLLVEVLDLFDRGVFALLTEASVTDINALKKLLEDGNGVAVGSRVLLGDTSHYFELFTRSHLLFRNFKEVLGNCLDMDGVHIIDLAVDYSLNHSILNVLLKEKTCIL